jgi:hypothetical protein
LNLEGHLTVEDLVDGLLDIEIVPHAMRVRVLGESDEPTLEEAMSGEERDEWTAAMESERESLYAMEVMEECELPSGRKAVKCRWVLKRKRDENGHIARYKARLVAKGFSQIPGQDFFFTLPSQNGIHFGL